MKFLKSHIYLLALLTVILAVHACGGKVDDASSITPPNTSYTEQKAMEIYAYDPMRALQIVDSAVIVGNMSAWRADMNRARIYSSTLVPKQLDSIMQWKDGVRLDSAGAIARRLVAHDSVKTNLGRQQDVLEILATTCRMQGDTLGWLNCSRRLVVVCRGQGAETEALRNEAEIAAALCYMGKETEGMARLDSVIDVLEVKKFNELDAMLIALKRKVCVLADKGRYAEMLPPARLMMEHINDYRQHPDQYHDGTYREPKDSTERRDYIEFYSSKAHEYITAAYTAIGEGGNMEESFNRIETIVREAAAREHLARYRAIEQQYEMQRQQAEARRMRQIAWIIGLFAILLLSFSLYFFFTRRQAKHKNRVLAREISEAIEYKRMYEELKAQSSPQVVQTSTEEASVATTGDLSDNQLFAHIREIVQREKLFLRPDFDRQAVIDYFHLTKEDIGSAVSKGSNFGNLAAFIRTLRLEYAAHLLRTTDMKVRDVYLASGFTRSTTFNHDFKAHFSLSPTEYRNQRQ